MEGQTINADRETRRERRTSRRRWCFVGGLVLVVAFHVPLLRALGRGLTAREQAEGCDAVLLLGGDHRLQVAAALASAGEVEQIWMIEGRPNYLVASGILPPGVEVATAELVALGVPQEQIRVQTDHLIEDLPDAIRHLGRMLEAAPNWRVLVTCEEFGGRHIRLMLDDLLDPDVALRVQILGLPDDDFDADRWWRSRSGLKQAFGEVCKLAFVLVAGTDPTAVPDDIDPDAIERGLQRRFGEAACFAH